MINLWVRRQTISYKYAVINNKPVGYWPMVFNSTLNNFYNYADQSNPATPAVGSTEVITDVAPLISRHVGDSDFHACRVLAGTDIIIPNVYNAFCKGYESKNFSIEAWVLLETITEEATSIIKLKDGLGSNTYLNLFVQDDNLFLSIYGNINYTIKKQIKNYAVKNHIYLSYQEGIFTLFINGVSETSVKIDKSFTFLPTTNTQFHIGTSVANSSYIISDIAFYDRALSVQEIKSHMFWATQDSNPMLTTIQGSTYSFDIGDSDNIISYKKDFNSLSSFGEGNYNGLIFKDGGLTIDTENAVTAGEWTYNFTPATYENSVGLSISWDSGQEEGIVANKPYINVSASFDQGLTFISIKNNQIIDQYISQLSNLSSANVFVKVELNSNGLNLDKPVRIDNLSIKLYKSLIIDSESGGFDIAPYSNTYSIRKDKYNFIARSKNFGISFKPNSDSYPSSAVISSTLEKPYEAIEFWFKYNGGGGAILDTSDIAGDDLYVDNISSELHWNLNALDKIYINGIEHTTSGYPIIHNEPYHIFIVYSSLRTTPIYLNRSISGTTSESNSVFGYISLYPTQISSVEVENRYISFLTINSESVNDGNTSFGSLIEYSGTSSSINSGFTVMAYDHIY